MTNAIATTSTTTTIAFPSPDHYTLATSFLVASRRVKVLLKKFDDRAPCLVSSGISTAKLPHSKPSTRMFDPDTKKETRSSEPELLRLREV